MGIFGDHAQKYWEYGLNVIPCDGQASNRTWTHLQEKRQTEEDLHKLIESCANDNIAVTMGKGSGVVAFDLDVDDLQVKLDIEKIIPPTPSMKFGMKGMTYFYKWTPETDKLRRCKSKSGKQLYDFLSTKTYTVVPPSTHPKNNNLPYVWIGRPLYECIDDLPIITPADLDRAEKYLKTLKFENEKESKKKEGRNNSLLSFVAGWYAKTSSIDVLVKKAIEYDKNNHPENPLFADTEEFKTRNVEANAFKFVSSVINSINVFKEDRGENKPKETVEEKYPTKTNGFFNITESESGQIIEKPNYLELARYLKNEFNFIHNEAVDYIYKDNYYHSVSEDFLRNKIVDLTQDKSQPRHVSQFLQSTKDRCYKNLDELERDFEGKINLKNGILDVKTMSLSPHTPESFKTYILDYNYNPDADCPKTLEFLDYVFEGDIGLVDFAFFPIADALYGGNPFLHKAYVLYGDGRNGKSTYLNMIMSVLGEKAFSSVSMKHLDKPFSTIMMHKKLANIVEETPPDKIDAEIFKSIVAGGRIQMSHKGKDEFSAKITARLFFACNTLPNFGDFTSGLIERLCIIPFKKWIPPNDRNPDIINDINAERSGILNRSLQALKILLKTKRLPELKALADVFDEYKEESDSVYLWASRHIESADFGAFISTDFFHEKYVIDMRDKVKNTVDIRAFGKRFHAYLKSKNIGDSKNNGAKRGIVGVRYKPSGINAIF